MGWLLKKDIIIEVSGMELAFLHIFSSKKKGKHSLILSLTKLNI